MRGGGAFTLVVSDGGAATITLVLLSVQVEDLYDVTALTRILVAAALFLGTCTSLDRQSATWLQAPDSHLNVILYVTNFNNQ